MDREEILEELKNRGADINSLQNTNDQTNFDREQILEVLKERGIGQTKSGEFLPTVEKQREEKGAYGNIVDVMEIPEANVRSQAVEDYLTSPEFGRLALEISGAVAGAAFPPLAVAKVPANVIVPVVVIGLPDTLNPVLPVEKATELTVPVLPPVEAISVTAPPEFLKNNLPSLVLIASSPSAKSDALGVAAAVELL